MNSDDGEESVYAEDSPAFARKLRRRRPDKSPYPGIGGEWKRKRRGLPAPEQMIKWQ